MINLATLKFITNSYFYRNFIMADIQQPQNTKSTFSFYLYDLEIGQVLTVSSTRPKKIVITGVRITTQNLSLFERAVIYLSPAQQARLPRHVKQNDGFISYLKACNLMIPNNSLPPNTSYNDRSKHQFNSNVAFKLLELSALQGFAPAQTVLSYCYDYGISIQMDLNKAIQWLEKAAKQKYPKAEYDLNNYYLHQFHTSSELEPIEVEIKETPIQPQAKPITTPPAPSPTPTPNPSPYPSEPKQTQTTPEWNYVISKIQSMEQKHRAEIQSLDQKHQGTIEALQRAHEASEKNYQDEIETLKQANKALNERLQLLDKALKNAQKTLEEKSESNKRVQDAKSSRPKRQKRAPKHLE